MTHSLLFGEEFLQISHRHSFDTLAADQSKYMAQLWAISESIEERQKLVLVQHSIARGLLFGLLKAVISSTEHLTPEVPRGMHTLNIALAYCSLI